MSVRVCCQYFQTSSPLKPLGRLKPNFSWRLLGTGERKFVQMVVVTWPRWRLCPYTVKTLKNLLLRNQTADDLGTWCSIGCSSATKFVQMMTLGWHWHILRQGQIWSLMLLYGEKVKQWIFSETIVVYDLKLATDDRSDKKFLLTSKLCPLGAVCPPAPGLYTCIKLWKTLYKIRLQSDFFETCSKWVKL